MAGRGVHDPVALWSALENFLCDITGASEWRHSVTWHVLGFLLVLLHGPLYDSGTHSKRYEVFHSVASMSQLLSGVDVVTTKEDSLVWMELRCVNAARLFEEE